MNLFDALVGQILETGKVKENDTEGCNKPEKECEKEMLQVTTEVLDLVPKSLKILEITQDYPFKDRQSLVDFVSKFSSKIVIPEETYFDWQIEVSSSVKVVDIHNTDENGHEVVSTHMLGIRAYKKAANFFCNVLLDGEVIPTGHVIISDPENGNFLILNAKEIEDFWGFRKDLPAIEMATKPEQEKAAEVAEKITEAGKPLTKEAVTEMLQNGVNLKEIFEISNQYKSTRDEITKEMFAAAKLINRMCDSKLKILNVHNAISAEGYEDMYYFTVGTGKNGGTKDFVSEVLTPVTLFLESLKDLNACHVNILDAHMDAVDDVYTWLVFATFPA